MKVNRFFLFLLSCSTVLTSCATYHISRESLLKQFAETQPEKKVTVFIAPPYVFYYGAVPGNNLRQIKVRDKNEKEVVLPVTNRTGVRIIKTDGSKKTFYFNTLLIKDSTITGQNTHFFKSPIRPIYLKDVEKIGLQK